MNVFRNIFAFVRNLVGGRVGSIEKLLIDGKAEVAQALKLRVLLVGRNATIAVSFGSQIIGDASGGTMVRNTRDWYGGQSIAMLCTLAKWRCYFSKPAVTEVN